MALVIVSGLDLKYVVLSRISEIFHPLRTRQSSPPGNSLEHVNVPCACGTVFLLTHAQLVEAITYNLRSDGADCLVPHVRAKVLKPSDGMCNQKGSFVDDEKLRFDFSWSGALTAEQVCP